MSFTKNRATLFVAGALLATSACGGNGAVPSNASNPSMQAAGVRGSAASQDVSALTVDTTSILKKLKKDVVIGSTVDPTNGDTGPRAVSQAFVTYGLKKGQLLVCNFADSTGAAGQGTTAVVLNPTPASTPTTFIQSSKIQGCDGDALTSANSVYASGLTSGIVEIRPDR